MTTPQAPDAGLRKALEMIANGPRNADLSYVELFNEDCRIAREALSAVPAVDVGGEGNSSSNASRAAQGTDSLAAPIGLTPLEKELLEALKALVSIRDWMIEVGGACEGPMPLHLLQEAAQRQAVAIPAARTAIAKAVRP